MLTVRRVGPARFLVERPDQPQAYTDVGYPTDDPDAIRQTAQDMRSRAARLLRAAEQADAVAAYLDVEHAERLAESARGRSDAARAAAATRARKADPFGIQADLDADRAEPHEPQAQNLDRDP